MRPRYAVLAVIALLVALGCFRLSKWQWDRLTQRRARNEAVAQRIGAAPLSLDNVPSDTGDGHYRRVTLAGTLDYDHEVALVLRSRDGSPGVYVLTPLRLTDDVTVLTNRGWVYAADGMNADLSKWREDERLVAEGFLDTFVEPRGPVTVADRPGQVRRLVRDSLTALVANGRTLYPYVVVITQPAPENAPARLAPPPLTDGSHLSYAFQWGAFGIIALAGMILAIRRGVTERHGDATATFPSELNQGTQ
jgi:surfeit locus 1 family protein